MSSSHSLYLEQVIHVIWVRSEGVNRLFWSCSPPPAKWRPLRSFSARVATSVRSDLEQSTVGRTGGESWTRRLTRPCSFPGRTTSRRLLCYDVAIDSGPSLDRDSESTASGSSDAALLPLPSRSPPNFSLSSIVSRLDTPLENESDPEHAKVTRATVSFCDSLRE